VDREVSVVVDGVELSMIPFVEKLVINTVAAVVGSLKGGEAAREITVAIRPKRPD